MRPSQRLAERSAKRHRNDPYLHIDLFGFVAIFVALLYLIFPGPPDTGSRFPPVNLPKSHNAISAPGANREDALIVSIDRAGRYYFGPTRLYQDDLENVLRKNLTKDVERRVFICADRRAKYRDVELALDAVRRAGIENVTFLTFQTANDLSQ